MISGNGLTIGYASFNKPTSITRGTNTLGFHHDPEHQRYKQVEVSANTLYLTAGGVLAEKVIGSGGSIQWNNYLVSSGGMIGVHIEKSDETVLTLYFHKDHLGSISTLSNEVGTVVERLSYDAWGKRRQPNGDDDPSGSLTSQTTRGFTGHEQLDDVGLIHMNGRVYDPLLARFGTPDPMTENPFSTQGWNRYAYVGNLPLNFTDPSGYCFLGCFWQPIFKAIGKFFRENWGSILKIVATMACAGNFACGVAVAAITSAVVAGVTSGNLGMALKAGLIAFATAMVFNAVGDVTLGPGHKTPDFMSPAHVANMAGHAAVGCASSAASGGKCGPGALSGAAGSFAGPMLVGMGFQQNVVAHAVVGGLASVAGGGKFGNGAVMAAFGYLFNQMADCAAGRQCTLRPFEIGGGGGYAASGTMDVGAAIGAGVRGLLGQIGGTLGNWVFQDEGVIDIDGSTPPFKGEPGSIVRGETQTRQYGEDGYPLIDRDLGHPDEKGIGCGDHCQDWGRPAGGGRPSHLDRGLPRLPVSGDPPPPRGPGVRPPF